MSRSLRSEDDLNRDAIMFLHYILLAYDIFDPANEDHVVWTQHMQQLKRFAVNRLQEQQTITCEVGHLLGYAIWLDAQAALAGKDTRGLANAIESQEIPPIAPNVIMAMPPELSMGQQEMDMMTAMVNYANAMLMLTARLSQLALKTRSDQNVAAQTQAALQARQKAIAQFRSDLWTIWRQDYPSFMPVDDPRASQMLSPKLRLLFEYVSVPSAMTSKGNSFKSAC